jgi:hypothetical protein
VRGFDGSELHFDGVNIAQNDFFYTFNAALTRRPWRVAVDILLGKEASPFDLWMYNVNCVGSQTGTIQ